MEHVIINKAGTFRKETLSGKPHYVVPLSMIVPGVLNGSKGALYYPPEEIARNYDAWNGMPLVIYHPQENGKPVSARSPSVLSKYAVGSVLNARIGKTGKLLAEGWIDIERMRTLNPALLSRVERGEKIELSTGLFTDNEPAQNGAQYNGKTYAFVAKNYRPDHLAILPDQVGACSLKDGCGVGVENSSGEKKGRCWKGYKPVKGKKPYSKGSCEPVSNLESAIQIILNASSLPKSSRRASAELDMTAEKACKILKDKSVRGHKLTQKQRGMFGAKCGERVTNQAIEILLNKWSPEAIAASAKARQKGKAAWGAVKDAAKATGKAGVAAGKDVAKAAGRKGVSMAKQVAVSLLQRIKARLGMKDKPAGKKPTAAKPSAPTTTPTRQPKVDKAKVKRRQTRAAKLKASLLKRKQEVLAKKTTQSLSKKLKSAKAKTTKADKKGVVKSRKPKTVKKTKSSTRSRMTSK